MYFKEKDARAMFDELDEDDSGYLEEMEVASLCRTLGKKLNKKSMEKAMAEMDTSGDGKVSPGSSMLGGRRMRGRLVRRASLQARLTCGSVNMCGH